MYLFPYLGDNVICVQEKVINGYSSFHVFDFEMLDNICIKYKYNMLIFHPTRTNNAYVNTLLCNINQ